MTDPHSAIPRTIETIERGITERLHIGAQLYVSLRGEPIADLGIGEARAGIPLTRDHLVLWMSSVKPVTAIAIAQQWELGRLALDDPVCTHIPEFSSKGKDRVTIRHVLTHTGGFPNAARNWSGAPWETIIAEICDCELEPGWIPGEQAGYHVASGWYILAEIVRQLDGRAYPQYVREAIFEPLGMLDSWIGMPAERHREYGNRIAPMHDASGEKPRPHPFPFWAGRFAEACAICRPGGSAWGPVRELGWFYEALLGGGQRDGRRIVNPQTIEAIVARHTIGMHDRIFQMRLDRGLGVVVDSKQYGLPSAWFGTRCSPRAFGHAGYQSSVAFADPKHASVVAIVFNGMIDLARSDARSRATIDAIYADLSLGGAGRDQTS